jgi:hypothetical protein
MTYHKGMISTTEISIILLLVQIWSNWHTYRYTGGLFPFRITDGGFRYAALSTSHVGTAPHILNFFYRKRMNCEILRSTALPRGVKTHRNHYNGELCGAQSRSERVVGEKNRLLPRIKPRFLGSPAARWILSMRNVRETPVFARIAYFHVQENYNSNKMTCCCYWLSWRRKNTSS